MKRYFLAIITAVLLCAAGLAATLTPAHASGATVGICKNSNAGGRCWNNWFGGGAGNAINYYGYNNGNVPNNGWINVEIGTVQNNGPNCGGFWPFTEGSGMNQRYQGQAVIQLQWAKNRNLSAFANYNLNDHGGPLEMEATDTGGGQGNCNVNDGELFVPSSENYLVSVFATNAEFVAGDPSFVPEFVGGNPSDPYATNDGHPVWVDDSFYWPFLQFTPQAP